jgi:hypothetical protein
MFTRHLRIKNMHNVTVTVTDPAARRRLAREVVTTKTAGLRGELALLAAIVASAAADALGDDPGLSASALAWLGGAEAPVTYRHAITALDVPGEWLPRGLARVDGHGRGHANGHGRGHSRASGQASGQRLRAAGEGGRGY